MIEILLISLITGLLCNGLQIATGPGMILEPIRRVLDRMFIDVAVPGTGIPPKVSKLYYPILYCIKCMPSVYGIALSVVFLPFTVSLIWKIPVIILCSVTISTAINQKYA